MGNVHRIKKSGFWLFLLLFLSSCQNEDVKQESSHHFSDENVSHKMVTATDIPEVMQFLRANTSSDLRYTIHTGGILGSQTRSGEPDLVISELMTEQILAVTNEANLTNYSFQLRVDTAPYYEGEVSFFNLVVKETTAVEGYYAYIQEYRMDENWYVSNESTLDFSTFNGKLIGYTLEGSFIISIHVFDGVTNHTHYRSPCPDPGGDPGGGGSGSGPGGGDPGGGAGGGTGGGTGGYNISIDYICGCEPGHIGGSSNPGCSCDLADIPVGINIGVRTLEGLILNELRNPCPPLMDLPPNCFEPNGDPCLYGCNEDGSCVEENPSTGVNPPNYNLLLILGLNNYLETPLTSEQTAWIHATNENYEFAEFILAEIVIEIFYQHSWEEIVDVLDEWDDYKDQMSASELAIFDSLSWAQQYKYLLSAYNATKMANNLYPASTQHNGLGDAYRHAFWNALSTIRLGEPLTEQLTTAHEDKPSTYPYNYKEDQMDLFNNQVGRQLVNNAGLLWQIVKTALENGELRYLKPLGLTINGTYYLYLANASSVLTPTNQ